MLKPFDPNELGVLIDKIIQHQQNPRKPLPEGAIQGPPAVQKHDRPVEPMQKVFSLICDVGPTESTVLINGETGTGKGWPPRRSTATAAAATARTSW
jgi:DNA-binding NtrC family response regulator